MSNPVFIDTDTASDDAVALMMAFSRWGNRIKAIGVVAGNCPLEQATINALYVADLCEAKVPVYMGAAKPLVRELSTAQHVHGIDGMGDIGLVATSLARSQLKPDPGYAPDKLIELADQHDGELVLVTLGPLTNVALALAKRPDIAKKISRCYMMGGTSDNYGNITPVSEFNIWADPESAEVVFASGMPVTMIGWDISRKYAEINEETSSKIRALGSRRAEVAVDCQRTLVTFCRDVTGVDGFDLPDPIAIAVAIDPTIATDTFEAAIHVSLNDDFTRGQTIIDDRSMTDRARNVTLVREASADRFQEMLFSTLR
jgi:purine nucleosidase